MENKRSSLQFLDGIRGLAALYVMIGHARWLLWEGFTQGYILHPQQYSLLNKSLMYFFSAFRFGHEAVLLFFVLSGFVIHLRYSRNIAQLGPDAKFDLFPYLKRRSRRIIPPLLFALLLTFILDNIGAYYNFSIYHANTFSDNINQNITNDHSVLTLAGNLLFVMKFYVPVFGTNGPLWSLAYEWWFYLLYPIFFLITRRSLVLATGILILFFVLAQFHIFPVLLLNKVFGLMLCWWLGALLADIYNGRIKISFVYLTPLSLLLLPLILGYFNSLSYEISSLLWSLAFIGTFSICFYVQESGYKLRILNSLKWLGDMSYTLYVIHMPIIVILSGWLMYKNNGVLPSHFAYVFMGIIFVLILSYFISLLIEKPFLHKKLSPANGNQ